VVWAGLDRVASLAEEPQLVADLSGYLGGDRVTARSMQVGPVSSVRRVAHNPLDTMREERDGSAGRGRQG